MNKTKLTNPWLVRLARHIPGTKLYGPYRNGVWYLHWLPGWGLAVYNGMEE